LRVAPHAPEAEGPGLHIVISAFDKRDAGLRKRTGPLKYAATLLTIGPGTPSGIVNPSVLLGNSMVTYLGRVYLWMQISKRHYHCAGWLLPFPLC